MARVRSVERGSQDIKVHPSEVDCFYQTVTDGSGRRLLHLSTFGSDGRESSPKSSQSLQIDEQMARELMQVLRSVFPGI